MEEDKQTHGLWVEPDWDIDLAGNTHSFAG